MIWVYISASAAFSLLTVVTVCLAWIRASEIKYGSERRISGVESRLAKIESDLVNFNPEKIKELRSEMNSLKLKVGLR